MLSQEGMGVLLLGVVKFRFLVDPCVTLLDSDASSVTIGGSVPQ